MLTEVAQPQQARGIHYKHASCGDGPPLDILMGAGSEATGNFQKVFTPAPFARAFSGCSGGMSTYPRL
jgi:hypothetical protein